MRSRIMHFRALSGRASASIRLTKLKLSASMYAIQLWADASIIERGTVYTRKKGPGVLLAVSYQW